MSTSIINNVFESFTIRTVIIEGDPWFIAKDVAEALGYKDTSQAVRKHCKRTRRFDAPSKGGIQEMNVIPESDVYRLIMRSRLKSAERFEDWVTEEVLPSIRKSGAFIAGVSDNHSIDSKLRQEITAEFARKGKDLLSDIDRHVLYGNPKRHEVLNLSDALSKRHGVPASLVEAMLFNGLAALEDF
ncbi:Bro-N domain-containing protein [Pantoea ananatis]|jgi:prophage antirepressor-like protein|uniref:BRO-N domain-containing protein n=1 Tax=Pantoea ananas TaxID=553 RepID=UPI002221B021|nr:Bro-N domain-containing protein [Pantoea ananatis]MCW1831979.1 Bro-N domain-containing protein [Pantoea ananatis]